MPEIVDDPHALWESLMRRWKQAQVSYEIAARMCLNLAASSGEFENAKRVEDAALKELVDIKRSIDDLINSSFESRPVLDGSLVVATIQPNNSISTPSTEMQEIKELLAPKQKSM